MAQPRSEKNNSGEEEKEERSLDEKLEEQVKRLADYHPQSLPKDLQPIRDNICLAALENGFSEKEKIELFNLLVLFENALQQEEAIPSFIEKLESLKKEHLSATQSDFIRSLFWIAAGVLLMAAAGPALVLLISLAHVSAVSAGAGALLTIGLGMLSVCKGCHFLSSTYEKKAEALFEPAYSLFQKKIRGRSAEVLANREESQALSSPQKKKLKVVRIEEKTKIDPGLTSDTADVVFLINCDSDEIRRSSPSFTNRQFHLCQLQPRKESVSQDAIWRSQRFQNGWREVDDPSLFEYETSCGGIIENTLFVVFSNKINSLEALLQLKEKLMQYADQHNLGVFLCGASFQGLIPEILAQLEESDCQIDLTEAEKRSACMEMTISNKEQLKGWRKREHGSTEKLFVFIEDGQLSYARASDGQVRKTGLPSPKGPGGSDQDISAKGLDLEIKFQILKMACRAGHVQLRQNISYSVSFDSSEVLLQKIEKRIAQRKEERARNEKPQSHRNKPPR
ncbi:MAG: hypothetical protein K0S27_375 [Gammaproteobacteria bacterium]|jgi:hypothetical protein|nr:hypothetical protein [Gammaproteobacteria bacterium]